MFTTHPSIECGDFPGQVTEKGNKLFDASKISIGSNIEESDDD